MQRVAWLVDTSKWPPCCSICIFLQAGALLTGKIVLSNCDSIGPYEYATSALLGPLFLSAGRNAQAHAWA